MSQIPSLLITIGSGLLVTKARSDETVGQELSREFFVKPKALLVAAGMVLFLGFVPGMPFWPFLAFSALLFALYRAVRNLDQEKAAIAARAKQASEQKVEEKLEDLIATDRLGVEIGYRLIPLVDKERHGTLLDRITALRRQLARDLGLLIPPIRVKDNIQLPPTAYRVLLYGQVIANGELHPDRLLAIDGGGSCSRSSRRYGWFGNYSRWRQGEQQCRGCHDGRGKRRFNGSRFRTYCYVGRPRRLRRSCCGRRRTLTNCQCCAQILEAAPKTMVCALKRPWISEVEFRGRGRAG